jgi:ADP-ribose pyrophosphatase YjhB (NUDIX family)
MNSVTNAAAAVITDPAGRVLLCQQSQGHQLWGLPGGKIRPGESPLHAIVRDVRAETCAEAELIDLVGLYQLTGDGCGTDLPDVLVHVFRARIIDGEVAVNAPSRISRLAWHDPASLPGPTTATTRAAIGDALAGLTGTLRTVERDDVTRPEESSIPVQSTAPTSALA